MLVKNNHLTQSSHINQKFKGIYFNTATRNIEKIKLAKKGGGKSFEEMELIRSLTANLSGHGGIRVSGTAAEGGERRRNSLLSSDLSSFEPCHKLFDCLVLEVGAHITGEGPISVTLFCCAETTESYSLSTMRIYYQSSQKIQNRFYFGRYFHLNCDINTMFPYICYGKQIKQCRQCAKHILYTA